MPYRLICAALVELIYCLITRVWLPARYQGIELEVLTTAGRLVSLLLFFLLFRQLIFSKSPQPRKALHPLALLVMVLVLLIPVFVGDYGLPNVAIQTVFAVTSVAVAFKEEFLYRGVLQNILEGRLGLWWALVLSNIVFTLYHYGAQPFTAWNLTEMFATGCILGLLCNNWFHDVGHRVPRAGGCLLVIHSVPLIPFAQALGKRPGPDRASPVRYLDLALWPCALGPRLSASVGKFPHVRTPAPRRPICDALSATSI